MKKKAVIFRNIQRNTYFEEHLRTTASEREALILYQWEFEVLSCIEI